MTREEAIKIANEMYGWMKTDREREALMTLAPELAESEDERIRHALIEFLREAYSRGNAPEECAKWIVWLDQPKEQNTVDVDEIIRKAKSEGRQEVIDHPEYYQLVKPEEQREEALDKIDEEVFEKIGNSFRRGREVGFREGVESVTPADYCSVRDDFDLDGNLNQKPAWSEEDEWKRKELIQYLEEKGDYRTVWMTWLKALRPYWKPSEELLDALDIVANLPELEYYGGIKDKIRELYKQLKKRYESNR